MAVTKPRAGEWKYDDLWSLPDDGKRYEIINGVLYEMPSPSVLHAMVVANVIALLLPLVAPLAGRVLTAPLDVRFPGADPVQPDVLVLLPERLAAIAGARELQVAPDLVVEVLSPSNPEHDRIRKREVYAGGGVREYWIVSPQAAIVEVLALGGEAYRTHVRAGGEETVTSTVLPALSFPASRLFS
jgi:Uma2 family endonuclease